MVVLKITQMFVNRYPLVLKGSFLAAVRIFGLIISPWMKWDWCVWALPTLTSSRRLQKSSTISLYMHLCPYRQVRTQTCVWQCFTLHHSLFYKKKNTS